MIVKQVSVFIENETGRLSELMQVLADNNIDMSAASIAETADYGILRCMVADPEAAVAILKQNNFTASIKEVIAVSTKNAAGELNKVLRKLADAKIAVGYIYSTVNAANDEAVIIVKVDDNEKALEVLK